MSPLKVFWVKLKRAHLILMMSIQYKSLAILLTFQLAPA